MNTSPRLSLSISFAVEHVSRLIRKTPTSEHVLIVEANLLRRLRPKACIAAIIAMLYFKGNFSLASGIGA